MKSASEMDALSLAEQEQLATLEKEAEERFEEGGKITVIFEHGDYDDVPAKVWRHLATNAEAAGFKVTVGIDSVMLLRN